MICDDCKLFVKIPSSPMRCEIFGHSNPGMLPCREFILRHGNTRTGRTNKHEKVIYRSPESL